MEKISEDMLLDLKKAIISINSVEECGLFFSDIFTGAEIEQFAQRLRAAKLLIEGNTYAQIIALTDISSATLSRVSNCVRRGSGGYKEILEKIKKL